MSALLPNCSSNVSLEELGTYSEWSGESGSISESKLSKKSKLGTLGSSLFSSEIKKYLVESSSTYFWNKPTDHFSHLEHYFLYFLLILAFPEKKQRLKWKKKIDSFMF